MYPLRVPDNCAFNYEKPTLDPRALNVELAIETEVKIAHVQPIKSWYICIYFRDDAATHVLSS